MQGFGPALFTFEWRASARSLAARQYRRLANEVAPFAVGDCPNSSRSRPPHFGYRTLNARGTAGRFATDRDKGGRCPGEHPLVCHRRFHQSGSGLGPKSVGSGRAREQNIVRAASIAKQALAGPLLCDVVKHVALTADEPSKHVGALNQKNNCADL